MSIDIDVKAIEVKVEYSSNYNRVDVSLELPDDHQVVSDLFNQIYPELNPSDIVEKINKEEGVEIILDNISESDIIDYLENRRYKVENV